MTKDEALKLALEALNTTESDCGSRAWEREQEAITAIKEALAESEPNYKKALEVWLDKTEWVQETVKPHELGMHRADVLKQRIEEALAQPEQEPVQVSPLEFVEMVMEKEHLISNPIFWAEWPNKEKNT